MSKYQHFISKKMSGLFIGFLIVTLISPIFFTATADAKSETTTLRIISTGDLHGQLTTTNYDSAGERIGSLAQVHTLIKDARSAIKHGNSLTVDLGDTIYGYGTEYVISNNGTEYMYEAMKNIGYDAITLGNHDFDYGYKYAKKQLQATSLSNLCVVSNVYNVETGKTVWNENKIITKTLKTTTGRTVSVKVGIIGVTLPTLTTYYNHKGILTTKTMVESTKEQIAKLKNKTDVIIVLAHGNMGTKGSGEIYDLTKIDGVDAIMFGHPHVNYPSNDNDVQDYYKLSGVNKKTGLINGIPVVSVRDRGYGVGIADLTLSVNASGKVSVKKSTAKISYAKKSTVSSSVITKYSKLYETEIKKTFAEIVGQVKDNASVTNYFGLLSDNTALQLSNEAKMQFGLYYTRQADSGLSNYTGYPVIAASSYSKFGKESYSDYIAINGKITVGDILNIQSYNHEYTCLYLIDGKQLREWLEYCASAYTKKGKKSTWSDANINDYFANENLTPVLNPQWIDDWSNFHIFDGIEYEIDTSMPARYDISGKVISEGYSRISKLTHNGTPVSDTTKFVLVSDYISPKSPVIGEMLSTQRLKKTSVLSSDLLKACISDQMEFGAIANTADNNWSVTFPSGEDYLVRSSSQSTTEAAKQDWYVSRLKTTKNYAYYQASFDNADSADNDCPTLIVSPDISVATNRNVTVMVQATDPSKVILCKYIEGNHDVDDEVWNYGGYTISSGSFTVYRNGTYSVMAMDSLGNKIVKRITISNIDSGILQVPSVDNYTNRKTNITGTGEPFTTIHFICQSGIYQTQIDGTGKFAYALPAQNAGSTIKVYLSDSSGRMSDTVSVAVNRTGPNLPEINQLTNKNDRITGDLNDTTSQIFAMIGNSVYVPENGGTSAYKASSLYDSTQTIVPAKYTTSGTAFTLKIPVQKANTKVKIYAVDKIGRISRLIKQTVENVAPNQPVIYTASNAENHVFGYVPKATDIYTIKVSVNGSTYTGATDSNGYFKIKTSNLKADSTITVTASDTVNQVKRTSAKGTRTVSDYTAYVKSNSKQSRFTLTPMTNKDTLIQGRLKNAADNTLYLKVGGKCHEIQTAPDGTFTFELSSLLSPEQKVYLVHRDAYSNIKEVAYIPVTLALPEKPSLVTEVLYNSTSKVTVFCEDLCTASVKLNGKVYSSKDGIYDAEEDGYFYQIAIEKAPADSTAYIYMENKTGKSERVKTSILAKVPELTDLCEVTNKNRKVAGTVLLVEGTETKIFAKVKEKGKEDKVYEGTIKENGSFRVLFDERPAEGSKIVVWAENTNGRSKKTIITVTEKEK